ncbi:ATP-binding protein [Mycolicibacterium hippocampi]|uniref:histidine kinase n=1 Tax=Mycolicibacterium hippocampi TaxID=659824 RepID=A0A7I9ZLD1_9MYCO|nr:ATP-binding protein [Mycolicibacterium hippocampi]GFH01835.1 histidine kinase [Mycolicibacterium hippocampi]
MADESGTSGDIDELRRLFLFENLTESQLEALHRDGREVAHGPGVLCQEGEPARFFYVLLEGEIALSKRSGDREIEFWRGSTPGWYCGAWSAFLLDDRLVYENTSSLIRPSRLFRLDATTLGQFLHNEFSMATHLLIAHSRGREHATRILTPSARLIQLGQMTAGLTHELNNPASAAVRAASELRLRISSLRHRGLDLRNQAISMEAAAHLVDLQDRFAELAATPNERTAVETSDLEETIGEWLEEHGVSEPWELSATFAEAGVEVEWLERVAASPCGATPTALDSAIQWLCTTIEAEQLLTEVTNATKRISVLVDHAKRYSQLDRAPFDLAGVHDLLEDTLAMLPHRLGPNLTVVRDFEPDLPAVPCYPAELNQVFTALMQNAFDALHTVQGGVLTLRTRREDDVVRIEVCDSGPGIPDDLLLRVFDPFFTTKPIGENSGLGLDIAARIVERHRGALWAESSPGNTRFITTLPLNAAAPATSATG